MAQQDFLAPAKQAFYETVRLKLQQFYRVVPKGQNSKLTGDFVEQVVRAFIKDWIAPCILLSGTLHPHDSNQNVKEEFRKAKQIDGIVFDPRLGPPILKEGEFIVVHPAFCRGIIEIKTSEASLREFEDRLQLLYNQYLYQFEATTPQVMGIVIQDSEPARHSCPDWLKKETPEGTTETPLFNYFTVPLCPIFILFNTDFEPYEPAIDAMMRAIFRGLIHSSRPPM